MDDAEQAVADDGLSASLARRLGAARGAAAGDALCAVYRIVGTLCSCSIELWIRDVCSWVGSSVAHALVSCALVCTNVGLATTYMRSRAPRSCFTILKCLLCGRVLILLLQCWSIIYDALT